MAIVTYQVHLKNHQGERVAVFAGQGRGRGGMQSFYYAKRLRTPGQFELRIDGEDERIDLFRLDYQIEFWRRDPWGNLPWYKDFETFYRSSSFEMYKDGRVTFIARGRGYNDLLMAEPIRFAAGSDGACKSGAAETVAKAYVNENIGPGAGLDSKGYSRVMPGLAIEADRGTGANWDGCRANQNLLGVLQEIAEMAPGDYQIVGTGPATFEFRWRDEQWGSDKRDTVILSPKRGSAEGERYVYSHLDEVNVVYVLGQGEGELRKVVPVLDTNAATATPWSRRAITRAAAFDDNTDDKMEVIGESVLDEQKAKRYTTFTAKQTRATRYGRDWNWGDLVTVRFRGMEFGQRITGVQVGLNREGEERIQPETESIDYGDQPHNWYSR